jgi:hypothetical protein
MGNVLTCGPKLLGRTVYLLARWARIMFQSSRFAIVRLQAQVAEGGVAACKGGGGVQEGAAPLIGKRNTASIDSLFIVAGFP